MLTIVGCGFVGSLFAEEMGKRMYALEQNDDVLCIDCDEVEERNAANQLFTREDKDKLKEVVVAKRLRKYGITTKAHHIRVEQSNYLSVLANTTLLVDAVDNLPTRRLLYAYGKAADIPVLHLGISQGGTGSVEWTYRDIDTWALSPINTLGQKLIGTEQIAKLKPCELVAFRGLGLNVGIAAAKAAGLWWGLDPENTLTDVMPRTLTTWSVTNTGHELVSTDTRYT